MPKPRLLICPLLLLLLCSLAGAQDVVHHKLPNGNPFPISAAVEVPAGKTLVFLSGMVAPVADPKAAKDSIAAYGDTKTQTIGALNTIKAELESLHLTLGDVIKMQVFMAGDPANGGKMDFAGFMQGYTQFFGTPAQPTLPVRSAMQVAALANPGFLVEIEVTAVRPGP
jgi:enamine deaminase RidA (YjgF/YER057c/UK114 family)